MKISHLLSIFLSVFLVKGVYADEGMWIPLLLKKYNIETMNREGFKLTADDIYSINQASLKDAVVGLGTKGRPGYHWCTGELVSKQGLMLTNHHCALNLIQSHSSLTHNYVENGFWASSLKDELTNPEVTASILVRIEDVTEVLNQAVAAGNSDKERDSLMTAKIKALETAAVKGSKYFAQIKPYFNGNQYLMSVYKIFNDVRLVGAPPAAIGKFGGDTDNWIWPRHTGDFSVLRIYADKNNEPCGYNKDNVPYEPKRFFKVSRKPLQEGDFTMVFGYPGTTNQYAVSDEIAQTVDAEYPAKIAIRTAKLDVIKAAMAKDELVRIKYVAKAASIANAWKKWQGEIKGINRFKTIAKKQEVEKRFAEWSKNQPEYANLLEQYHKLYAEREQYVVPLAYASEAGVNGAELLTVAQGVRKAVEENSAMDKAAIVAEYKTLTKDFDANVDKQMMLALLKLYKANVPNESQPAFLQSLTAEHIGAWVDKLYKESIFASEARFTAAINRSSKPLERMNKDKVVAMTQDLLVTLKQMILPEYTRINNELAGLKKSWVAGLMKMQSDKVFFPDANSTLRVSYGSVGGYVPVDGVRYGHFTSLGGIIEKGNMQVYDYVVPEHLKELYLKKDFGAYTQNGDVPVCFVASNHTTGGNSGSPVINDEGALIGINFDRAWEGVMSDMDFQPSICRNIAVDIRYVLFIIDKYAGAQRLIDEMEFQGE